MDNTHLSEPREYHERRGGEAPGPVYTDFSTCERRDCRPSHRESYHEPLHLGRFSLGGTFYANDDRSALEAAGVLNNMRIASSEEKPTLAPLKIPASGHLGHELQTGGFGVANASPPQTLEPPLSAGTASQATPSPQTPLTNGGLYNPPRRLSSSQTFTSFYQPQPPAQQPQLSHFAYSSPPIAPEQYWRMMPPPLPASAPPHNMGYYGVPSDTRHHDDFRSSRHHERGYSHPNYGYAPHYDHYDHPYSPHDNPPPYVRSDPTRYGYTAAPPISGVKRRASLSEDDSVDHKPRKKPKNPEKMKSYVCFFRDCDESNKVPPRKAVSQFFGRNKACTSRIPAPVWLNLCRKHYQQRSYRQRSRFSLSEFQAWLVGLHFDNCDKFEGDRDWHITFDKKLMDAIHEHNRSRNTKSKGHKRSVENHSSSPSPSEDTKADDADKKSPKKKTPPDERMVAFALELEERRLAGHHKTTADCRKVLKLMDMWSDDAHWPSGLPYIEFLPMGEWGDLKDGEELIRNEADLDESIATPEMWKKTVSLSNASEQVSQVSAVAKQLEGKEVVDGSEDEAEAEDRDGEGEGQDGEGDAVTDGTQTEEERATPQPVKMAKVRPQTRAS